MRKSFSLLLFLFSFTLTAQNAQVSGKLVDDQGSPLGFANVLLLNASDSTLHRGDISDAEGAFFFEKIEQGNYIIKSSMIGYTDQYSAPFMLREESKFEVPTLQLSSGVAMEEVVVTSKRPLIELKADKMVVNVENSSVAAGNSALEVLQKSPGVVVDNNQNISLRGKQGVLVTINGKNQYMTGDEITRMLENMPASNIKTIEIITNPSAKYDAEGNSGIINIVLKKNERLGTNGNLSTTYRQGREASHFHNLNLNHRTENVNIYGGGEYYNWGQRNELNLTRDIPYLEGNTVFEQTSTMSDGGDGYNARLGVDWTMTPNTTLSFLAKRNGGDEQDNIDNMTRISGDNMPIYDVLAVDTEGDEDYLHQTYNANLEHKFNDKGMTLTVDADLSSYENDVDFMYNNFFEDVNGNEVADPFLLRNTRQTGIDIFAGKVDLTLPVNEKLNLEVGTKVSMVDTENGTKFEYLDEVGNWIDQVQRSNEFEYTEDVWAAYINGSGSIGQFMIQGGLRLEHTESEGYSVTLNQRVPRSYTNLFPSISISTSLLDNHNMSISYSRRLERPNYRHLNPFEDFLDQYTFSRGNPFLNPQYSNAIGLNYAVGRKLFISLNYSHTTDANTEVIEQVSSENLTYQTRQNLDDYTNFSATISMPHVWTEWWTSRLNYTSFYNNFSSAIPSGQLDNSGLAHIVNVSNEIALPGGWQMEVSGNIQTGLVFGLFELDPQGALDLGFSKRLMDNKASLRFNVNDIFRTRVSQVRIMQDDINLVVDQVNDTRRASVNFSYSFGNQKVKAARKRKTAAEEEAGRI